MILSTYEHYLDCLKPFANDSSIKLTAPSSLFDKLAEIAVSKNTHRLDICRHALAEYIHNHEERQQEQHQQQHHNPRHQG